MSNRSNNLKAKVKAVNRAHKYAGELYDQLGTVYTAVQMTGCPSP